MIQVIKEIAFYGVIVSTIVRLIMAHNKAYKSAVPKKERLTPFGIGVYFLTSLMAVVVGAVNIAVWGLVGYGIMYLIQLIS